MTIIVRDEFDDFNAMLNTIESELISSGIEPEKTIYDNYGEVVFKVYHFYLQ